MPPPDASPPPVGRRRHDAAEAPGERALEASPGPRSLARAIGLTGSVLLLGVIGWFDYVTGPDIAFSLFYLLPVIRAGWRLGAHAAAFTASVAAIAWFVADVAVLHHSLGISIWNAFTRLLIFQALGLLTARLQADRRRLRALTEQLEQGLRRERELARTDSLTGLPNSRAFLEQLGRRLEEARSRKLALAVMYVDLDNFKQVNDRLGHGPGDEALRRIATALRLSVRGEDALARLGGDEFACVISDIGRDALEAVARRIQARAREVARDYPDTGLGTSIGVALFTVPPGNPEEALRRADDAMYRAKLAGKDCFVTWCDEEAP